MEWLGDVQKIIAQKVELSRRSLEETLVKRLLGSVGCSSLNRIHSLAVADGFDYATFEWFSGCYPRFPIRLTVARLKDVHKISVPDLFGARFAKTRIVREYADYMAANDLDPHEARVGMVFRWPAIVPGGNAMVLHNYPPDAQHPNLPAFYHGGTKIVRPYDRVVYVIEAFHDLMAWTADMDWFDG